MSEKKKLKTFKDIKESLKENEKIEEAKDFLKNKKDSFNVDVNLDEIKDKTTDEFKNVTDEIKEDTKSFKDKVKDLPGDTLESVGNKIVDNVKDLATDYATEKVVKGGFFKKLTEMVIKKIKKIFRK